MKTCLYDRLQDHQEVVYKSRGYGAGRRICETKLLATDPNAPTRERSSLHPEKASLTGGAPEEARPSPRSVSGNQAAPSLEYSKCATVAAIWDTHAGLEHGVCVCVYVC